MDRRAATLYQVMTLTGTTAGRLAGFSGVGESLISQFVCGEGDFDQAELDLLLACMGFEIKPDRSIAVVEMSRSECRSWLAHRELSAYLTKWPGIDWQSTVFANIDRLRRGTRGQPHMDNLDRWRRIAEEAACVTSGTRWSGSTAVLSKCARSHRWVDCSPMTSVVRR